MSKERVKLLIDIYMTFFKLGSISFGGGYSMIPLIEREVVEEKKWLDREKIIDVFAVSQSIPGAIAMNASGFVGYSIAGIPGAIAAMIGNVMPSTIIVLILVSLFTKVSTYPVVKSAFKGVYPVIVSMIAYAAFKIGKTAIVDIVCTIMAVTAFGLLMFWHFDPVIVIILGALTGLALMFIKGSTKLRHMSDSLNNGGKK